MPTISGLIHEWRFGKHSRLFSSMILRFSEALKLMRVNPFDGLTNKGEQRLQLPAHVSSISAAVRSGKFTPTPWCCNVPSHMQSRIKIEDGQFRIELSDNEFLSQTDGGHRRESLLKIIRDSELLLKKERSATKPNLQVIAELELAIKDVQQLPISVTVYLDGPPATDFLNLQRGRSVDKSTVFALESACDEFDDPAYNSAIEIARLLHKDRFSPFTGNIRLDAQSRCSLPLNTVCAKGKSDLSTSLIGLGIIGEYLGLANSKLAACITRVYQAVERRHPGLLQKPSPLTPLSNSGTLAASCMWCGLGILLALRASHESLDAHAEELAETCYEVLAHVRIEGSFSSGMKRQFMGELAKAYFRDWTEPLHDGVPLVLCQHLSSTAYAVTPLKKSQKVTRA